MMELCLQWMAYKTIGLNQHALVSGMARALNLNGEIQK